MTGRDPNPLGLSDDYQPPPLPASMPTMVFMHSGNDTYFRLRGGPLFETMRSAGYKVALPDETGNISLPTFGRLMVLMDPQLDATEWVESLRNHTGSVVLVDVTGPIWNPGQIIELDPGTRNYWAAPGRRERALHLLRIADGITTPHVGYVNFLMNLNEQVFVLPDLDEEREESCADFTVRLTAAWHTAMEAKVARLRAAPAPS
jgi:hypothetical protein